MDQGDSCRERAYDQESAAVKYDLRDGQDKLNHWWKRSPGMVATRRERRLYVATIGHHTLKRTFSHSRIHSGIFPCLLMSFMTTATLCPLDGLLLGSPHIFRPHHAQSRRVTPSCAWR